MNLKYIFSTTWGIPVVLCILSIFGLLSALIGDNIWDVVSWMSLSIPLIIASRFLLKKPVR